MTFSRIDERIESVRIYKKIYGYKIVFHLGRSIGSSPRETHTLIREEMGCGKFKHHSSPPDMHYHELPTFTVICRFLGRKKASEKLCEMKLSFIDDKLKFHNYWFITGPKAILKFFYHFFFDSWR